MSGLVTKKTLEAALGRHAKKSNLECVVDFLLSVPGELVLNDEQNELLKRLEMVDELFRSGKYNKRDIAALVAKRCEVSASQSRRDVEDAEFAFGSTKRTNKAGKLFRHYDRLESLYLSLIAAGNHELAIKVADQMTKALAIMPEDQAPNRAATPIIMNFTQTNINQFSDKPISGEDAEEVVKKYFEIEGVLIDENE